MYLSVLFVLITLGVMTGKAEGDAGGYAVSHGSHGPKLLWILCNKKRMILVRTQEIQFCNCEHGYYLNIRSRYPPYIARCEHCENCKKNAYRPYEELPCSEYSPPLCSHDSSMTVAKTAEEGAWGYAVFRGSEGPKLIPILCNKKRMVLVRTQELQFCNCKHGYYHNIRNSYHPYMSRCERCENCKKNAYLPHEALPCREYSPPLCCQRSSMIPLTTNFQEICDFPIKQPNTEIPMTTTTTTTTITTTAAPPARTPPTTPTTLKHVDKTSRNKSPPHENVWPYIASVGMSIGCPLLILILSYPSTDTAPDQTRNPIALGPYS